MALGLGTDTTQNYKGSIAYYTRVLAIDSTHKMAMLNRGRAYAFNQENEKALADINKAVQLYPGATSYSRRGDYYMMADQISMAYADFVLAIQLDSTIGDAWYGIAVAKINEQDYLAAHRMIDKADRLSKFPLLSHLCRAALAMKEKDYAALITESTAVLRQVPDKGLHFNNRGYAKISLGQYAEAESDIDMALRLKPGTAYPLNNKAIILLHKGDPSAALTLVNQSLSIDSLNAYAYKNRGEIYLALNEKKKACADFEKTIKLSKDSELSIEAGRLGHGCGK